MAENDIYNNEGKYERFKENLKDYLAKPKGKGKRKYWIKNKDNIKYFKELFDKFEARDNSYIRRLRLLRTFLLVNFVLKKDLKDATREDIDKVMAFSHSVNKSIKSKRDFAIDIKFIWKQLFPEKDDKNRVDETIIPYAVRHLSGKIDKSKEKLRGDKFSYDEFERLVQSFSDDVRIQALLTISLESLARPQEILGRKIKDVEFYDNYAKIYISEHGKEGTGILRVIDSYFYFAKWWNMHPLKHDPEAFLFVNTGRVNRYKQMKPFGVNKVIRDRCKKIGINKPITLYSLKRNGVTMMRLEGRSDLDIQHVARWTSSKQLKTYDLSTQEDSLIRELIKKGKIKAEGKYKEFKDIAPKIKKCPFCDAENGIGESVCINCKRPLEKKVLLKREDEINKMQNEIEILKKMMTNLKSNDLNKNIQSYSKEEKKKFYIECDKNGKVVYLEKR